MNGGMGRYTVGQTTRWLGEWVARERDGWSRGMVDERRDRLVGRWVAG